MLASGPSVTVSTSIRQWQGRSPPKAEQVAVEASACPSFFPWNARAYNVSASLKKVSLCARGAGGLHSVGELLCAPSLLSAVFPPYSIWRSSFLHYWFQFRMYLSFWPLWSLETGGLRSHSRFTVGPETPSLRLLLWLCSVSWASAIKFS